MKIRDKERLEPPHASILFKDKAWRIGLRDGEFLDGSPSPKDVPKALLAHVEVSRNELCSHWNLMYPNNPLDSTEDES